VTFLGFGALGLEGHFGRGGVFGRGEVFLGGGCGGEGVWGERGGRLRFQVRGSFWGGGLFRGVGGGWGGVFAGECAF